jgi:hypothetical protein
MFASHMQGSRFHPQHHKIVYNEADTSVFTRAGSKFQVGPPFITKQLPAPRRAGPLGDAKNRFCRSPACIWLASAQTTGNSVLRHKKTYQPNHRKTPLAEQWLVAPSHYPLTLIYGSLPLHCLTRQKEQFQRWIPSRHGNTRL